MNACRQTHATPLQGSKRRACIIEPGSAHAGAASLSHASVEAVARRVVELLQEHPAVAAPRFVDAQELARILGISRSTVYERARELGAIRVGHGTRARLRFDAAEATRRLGEQPQPSSRRRRSATRRFASRPRPPVVECELLPIREQPAGTSRR